MDDTEEIFLVTGAMGCIGSWAVSQLIRRGKKVIAFDLDSSRHRLDLLLDPEEQTAIHFVEGDITLFNEINEVFLSNRIDRVIHLAALQVPACRANPVLGASVNMMGTGHIFEACRQAGIKHLAYASTAAVYGPPLEDSSAAPLSEESAVSPMTLYGVFKKANEGQARNYWQDYGVSSIGLRPHTVYGLGRDQGMTSDPTKAMLAAAAGRSFQLQYANGFQLQYASDVAKQFIDAATDLKCGAFVFNLGGEAPSMEELVSTIKEVVPGADINYLDQKLPLPDVLDDSRLRSHFETVHETPVKEGVERTIQAFQGILAKGSPKLSIE